MKKASALLLLFLFLITNSGMAVSAHWCGGKLTSVDFFTGDKHPCKCGKKSMKPNCCKDTTTHLKASDELSKTNTLSFKMPVQGFQICLAQQSFILSELIFLYSGRVFHHPPPYKLKAPIYLLHGVFLI